MKKIKILCSLFSLFAFTSCYEDYVNDYEYSTVYFAHQKPLRTIIADRNMSMNVGVAIGGKREVDKNDWAEFKIDYTLLEGTSFKLLPESHYTLSDENTFKVSKTSLQVADVTINFTEEFYKDENSVKQYYAIPFEVVSSSLDSILDNRKTSIVAVKYISAYHGEFYVKGVLSELDTDGTVIGESVRYENADLSKNLLRSVSTISRNVVCREGLANFNTDKAEEKVQLTINSEDNTVKVGTAPGGIAITDGNGTYEYSFDEEKMESKLEISITYKFSKDGKNYKVDETLIRRQDPYRDFRFEEWK